MELRGVEGLSRPQNQVHLEAVWARMFVELRAFPGHQFREREGHPRGTSRPRGEKVVYKGVCQ